MSIFIDCEVKLQANYQDEPLLGIIRGVHEEPGENFFYAVELSDQTRIHINIASVEWIEINKKITDKKKKVFYLKDHGSK